MGRENYDEHPRHRREEGSWTLIFFKEFAERTLRLGDDFAGIGTTGWVAAFFNCAASKCGNAFKAEIAYACERAIEGQVALKAGPFPDAKLYEDELRILSEEALKDIEEAEAKFKHDKDNKDKTLFSLWKEKNT